MASLVPPQFISEAEAVAATVNLPTFAAGDVAFVFAFRDGSVTAPTLPAGWNSIASGSTGAGATGGASIAGWRKLVGGDTTTGTWTNATDIAVQVWRGVDPLRPVGGSAQNGAASNQPNYAALTMTRTDGSSSVAGFAISRTATDVSAGAVSGMTTRSAGTNTASGNHSLQGATSFGSSNYTATVNAATTWRSVTIEILAGTPNVPTMLTKGTANPAATTTATASVSPSASKVTVICYMISRNGAAAGALTASGAARGTWTTQTSIQLTSSNTNGYRCGYILGTGTAGTSAITLTCSQTMNAALWFVFEVDAVAAGQFYSASNDTTPTNCNVTPTSFNFAGNMALGFWFHGSNEGTTPPASPWTELDDTSAGFVGGADICYMGSWPGNSAQTATWATNTTPALAFILEMSNQLAPAAGNAAGTGAAGVPTVTIAPSAQVAAGTGTALQPASSVKPNVGVASGTGAAGAPTANVAPTAGVAAGVGAAGAPKASIAPNAGVASGIGTAYNPAASLSVSAGVASGTGVAGGPSVTIAPNTGVAAGVGAAYNPAVVIGQFTYAPAEVAAGVGAAGVPTVSIAPNAGAGVGTGDAGGATENVAPTAGVAAGVGQAFDTSASSSVGAGVAAGSGSAGAPHANIAPNAGIAAGAGQAFNPSVAIAEYRFAPAGVAAGVGQAFDTSVRIAVNAGLAAGSGTAYNPDVTTLATPIGGVGGAELVVSENASVLSMEVGAATLVEGDGTPGAAAVDLAQTSTAELEEQEPASEMVGARV